MPVLSLAMFHLVLWLRSFIHSIRAVELYLNRLYLSLIISLDNHQPAILILVNLFKAALQILL